MDRFNYMYVFHETFLRCIADVLQFDLYVEIDHSPSNGIE